MYKFYVAPGKSRSLTSMPAGKFGIAYSAWKGRAIRPQTATIPSFDIILQPDAAETDEPEIATANTIVDDNSWELRVTRRKVRDTFVSRDEQILHRTNHIWRHEMRQVSLYLKQC